MRKKKVNLQTPINTKIFQDFKQISIQLFMNTKAQMSGR